MRARNTRHQHPIQLLGLFLLHHLESSGIPVAHFVRLLPDGVASFEELDVEQWIELAPRLFASAKRRSGDEHLLLHAGERFHFCLAGIGGLTATHAPTSAMALETFGRFVSATDVLEVASEASEHHLTLYVEVRARWPRPARLDLATGVLAGIVAALRGASLPSLAPVAARLSRPTPANRRDYERAFGTNVDYGCDHDALVISRRDLTLPSPLYQPQLYEQLQFLANLTSEQPAAGTPLRRLVEQAIRAGSHNLAAVAETLQVPPRTLQRRLRTEGTTFRMVLNEVRVDLARQLLQDASLPIPEIAQRLHYSDDKSFRKAFKAVTGLSPTAFRGGAQSQPDVDD